MRPIPDLARRILSPLVLAAALGTPALAAPDAADYLSARSAAAAHDYAVAADRFLAVLEADPEAGPQITESALAALLAAGEVDRALDLPDERLEGDSQIAGLLRQIRAARAGDWEGLLSVIDAGDDDLLVNALSRGWALYGTGDVEAARGSFAALAESPGLLPFALYHEALMLAASGDFDAAAEILDRPEAEGLLRSRRGALAYAQIQAQSGNGPQAAERLRGLFPGGLDIAIGALVERIEAGEDIAFDLVQSAQDGLAEVHFSFAGVLEGDAPPESTLIFARAAQALKPDHVDALLLLGNILGRLGRPDLAGESFAAVPRNDPSFPLAELGRAEALAAAEQPGRAIEVLQQLTAADPELTQAQVALGQMLSRQDDLAGAEAAYTRAIEQTPEGSGWWLLYARGMAREAQGNWDGAEADMRAALDVTPDQPAVLNFLGYSLVERGERLDEALGMIERAVALRPEDGAIVDSLGWAQFKLGRYAEAVGNLERAVSLLPVDPILNDHLGDAFWAVGRLSEAQFQWRRALSFDPEPEEEQRIRQKLERGLDAVLAEEGADPLRNTADGQEAP
ncbi:tetratricopeptide repeat protein [Pseudoroseicyclus aestuarii]|uniref:Tetratricopeptide repeat protein n=1 Tax=Pseudoroseicyclus aestuarii TaxID=1795041 RepID=A0A318ST62_9RHOB|nr:tetratricopeptide repeat protein [Pseudoroseicyclus aestuarii]PYE84652.1 tetratricopeptide repeat protein [Pseudoroseicyclus aestuarii]